MNALVPSADDASLPSSASIEVQSALVDRLNSAGRRSTAEMLHELRRAFPDSPLAVRVRALEALRKR